MRVSGMAGSVVYNAVKDRLVAEFGATYPIRDFEEIETQLQQGTDPWMALEDFGGDQLLTSVGTPQQNWVEDELQFDIHVFTPSRGGLDNARVIADAVRASFQFVRLGTGIRVDSVSAPAPNAIHDGLWHLVVLTLNITHRYAVATAAE